MFPLIVGYITCILVGHLPNLNLLEYPTNQPGVNGHFCELFGHSGSALGLVRVGVNRTVLADAQGSY